MPRLTLADSLHNLPYSIGCILLDPGFHVSDLGSLVPGYGILSLTGDLCDRNYQCAHQSTNDFKEGVLRLPGGRNPRDRIGIEKEIKHGGEGWH